MKFEASIKNEEKHAQFCVDFFPTQSQGNDNHGEAIMTSTLFAGKILSFINTEILFL